MKESGMVPWKKLSPEIQDAYRDTSSDIRLANDLGLYRFAEDGSRYVFHDGSFKYRLIILLIVASLVLVVLSAIPGFGITAFFLIVGLVGATIWYLFNRKFGGGSFQTLVLGLSCFMCSGLFVFLAWTDCSTTFECSHQSGKCIKITKNLLGQVVASNEFDISHVTALLVSKHLNHARRGTFTTETLDVIVDGNRFEIPRDGSRSLEEQRKDFYLFLTDKNARDYKLSNSNLFWEICLILGPSAVGLFFIYCAFLPKKEEARDYATEANPVGATALTVGNHIKSFLDPGE